MQVVTLEKFGEDRFLSELDHLKNEKFPGDARNSDWFNRIPEIYKTRFKEWFFLIDNNNLAAFATIQEFYPNCFRLLTRTYYLPSYRRRHLAYEHNQKTPAMHLLDAQLEYIKDYCTLFISMQDITRRRSLKKVMNKIGADWNMHPGMVQTCKEVKDINCWQNVIYKGDTPNLPSITIEEWKTLKEQFNV
jgi:hypothetical protein